MKRFSSVWTLVFLIMAGASGLAGAVPLDQPVELVSKADPAPDVIGQSSRPALSADGRWIAFVSTAPNLVPGQADESLLRNHADTFLHDQVTGTTVLVSHAASSPSRSARQPEGSEDFQTGPQISADGRYVAFLSSGVDLVLGISDVNKTSDVFLYDRVTGTTTLISHAAGSPTTTADGVSYGLRISADGNYVAFTSRAKNLVAGQSDSDRQSPSSGEDAFLWSRSSGMLTLLSRKAGTPSVTGDNDSRVAGISADGNAVLFTSEAADLLPPGSDQNRNTDVFVYQRSSNDISLISRVSGAPLAAAGAGFINDLTEPVISDDGRYVAFVSWADNLVLGQVDPFFSVDAFLYDRVLGEMRLVSHNSVSPQTAGGMPEFYAGSLAINADGRYVAFVSRSSILFSGQVDTNRAEDIFIYDRVTRITELATHAPGSPTTTVADSNGFAWPSLSADGRFLSYQSLSDEIFLDQTNAFLYDRSSKKATLISRVRGSVSTPANDFSGLPRISADGSVIAFNSQAAHLDGPQADRNNFLGLFLYHRASDEITSPAHHAPDLPALAPNGPSVAGGISADGRFVLFQSPATGFIPGQIDHPYDSFRGTWDVFLRDRVAGTTVLVSRSAASPTMAAHGLAPVLSTNGQLAAFIRTRFPFSGDLTPGQLHLYDRTTATLTLVTHAPGSATEPDAGEARGPSISADGRYLAYSCARCNLVPGYQGNDGSDVFLYDRVTGTNMLVSHASGSTAQGGDNSSESPLISADGRFVVFYSGARNLVPRQTGEAGNVFVFDRTTGAIALVSRTPASAVTAAGGFLAGLSANGRFIAFYSSATNLVPGQVDLNPGTDLFLHDRVSGTTVLVSHAASSPVTAGNVEFPHFTPQLMISISDDGRFLVYESTATDLVAGVADTNDSPDVFLYDRLSGTNTLVSRWTGPGFPQTQYPRISADGSRIAFLNVTGTGPDLNLLYNLYVRDRGTGKTDLIGPAALGLFSSFPHLSDDGRRIAFTTDTPFVKGDFNGVSDAYLWSDGFLTLPNCKLLDTRRRADRPVLTSNVQRTVTVRGVCGVPATAKQVVVKVTVLSPSGKGNLRFYPGAVTATPSGILRFERNATRTETFTVPLSANGTLTILPLVAGRGTVHVAVEVTGYSP